MRRSLVTIAAALGLSFTAVPGAQAASPAPWQPYEGSGDFVVAAGDACDFPLAGHIVSDKERYRTTAFFPDGSPRVQEFTGQLVIEYTNQDSGESVVRNLTGRGDFEYLADGGFSLRAVGGHFAATLHPGDDPFQGYVVVSGRGWQLDVAADGHRTLTYGKGTIENLCDTLA